MKSSTKYNLSHFTFHQSQVVAEGTLFHLQPEEHPGIPEEGQILAEHQSLVEHPYRRVEEQTLLGAHRAYQERGPVQPHALDQLIHPSRERWVQRQAQAEHPYPLLEGRVPRDA